MNGKKETICMKCQTLFSGEKNKKNIINWLSAEFFQRVVKVKALKLINIKKIFLFLKKE